MAHARNITVELARQDEAVAALEAMAGGGVEKDVTLSQYAQAFMSGQDALQGSSLGGPADPYRQSLWVNACITAILAPASRVPLRLSRGEALGTKGFCGSAKVRFHAGKGRVTRREKDAAARAVEGEIIESGDLFSLLERPNPGQTWRQFIEQTIGLLYCDGRVHWLFDEMIGRRPVTMYVVRGKGVKPYTDKRGHVEKLTGWQFTDPHGGSYDVALDECVTFAMFNPEDANKGLPPSGPANLAIVSDYNASLYNAAMFGNSAEPGGALKIPQTYNPELDQQIKSYWNQRHRGAAKAKTPALLWGNMEWQAIASTMAEMQFDAGKRLCREEICTAYRVPPAVAGFTGTTGDASAYYQAEQERFWQDTEIPLLEKIAEAVDVHLAPRFLGNLEAWFDVESVPVVQKMKLSRLDAADKLWNKGVPLADLDELLDLGIPERPWHKIGFLPSGILPADQVAEGNVFPTYPEGPTPADPQEPDPIPEDDTDQTPNEEPSRSSGAPFSRSHSYIASTRHIGTHIPGSRAATGAQSRRIAAHSGAHMCRDCGTVKAPGSALWKKFAASWEPLARECGSAYRVRLVQLERQVVAAIKRSLTAEAAENAENEGNAQRTANAMGRESLSPVGAQSATWPESQPSANALSLSASSACSAVNKDSVGSILIAIFQDAKSKNAWKARMQTFIRSAHALGIRQALSEAGLSGTQLDAAAKKLLAHPAITAAIRTEALKWAVRLDDQTRKLLQRNLQQGIDGGESINQLADRVQSVMGNRRAAAVGVARNAVGESLSSARHSGARSAGQTHKRWLFSRGDGQRRPEHVAAERVYASDPMPIDEPFIINGSELMYPRDPSGPAAEVINCQCVQVYLRVAPDKKSFIGGSVPPAFVGYAESKAWEEEDSSADFADKRRSRDAS
jgi:HK97 family phage portal protein